MGSQCGQWQVRPGMHAIPRRQLLQHRRLYVECRRQQQQLHFGGCASAAMQASAPCSKFGCYWNGSTCNLTSRPERTNGSMVTDFTGAIAGQFTANANDRSVNYQCSDGCASEVQGNGALPPGLYDTCASVTTLGSTVCSAYPQCYWTGSTCVANCCPICNGIGGSAPGGLFQSPDCFFASRLPGDDGNGFEFGLLMAEWAMYRAGARSTCGAAQDASSCTAIPGCVYYNAGGVSQCMAGYCDLSSYSYTLIQGLNQCNGNYPQVSQATIASSSPSAPNPNDVATTLNLLDTLYRSDVGGNCNADLDETGRHASRTGTRIRGTRRGSAVLELQLAGHLPDAAVQWQSGLCIPNPVSNGVRCSATDPDSCCCRSRLLPMGRVWLRQRHRCSAVFGCTWSRYQLSATANGGTCRAPLSEPFVTIPPTWRSSSPTRRTVSSKMARHPALSPTTAAVSLRTTAVA